MARKPKVAKKELEAKSDLIQALEFVCLNQKDTPLEVACLFEDQQVTTFNGIVTLGHPVQGDLSACVQSKRLLAALHRIDGAYSIAQDGSKLTVQGGKLKVPIACYPLDLLASGQPDPICGLLSNDFRTALDFVGQWAVETGSSVEMSSVLCKGQSVFSTDRIVAVEYWHGINFPELVIPKTFITLLSKIKFGIVAFGFSDNSLTIHFENKAWIKTQLYQDKWPNLIPMFDRQTEQKQLPIGFKEAINNLFEFAEINIIVGNEAINTHKKAELSASFDIKCDQTGIFNSAKLASVLPYIETIDFCSDTNKVALFYGKNIRGIICQSIN
jgi:hypothetical protein